MDKKTEQFRCFELNELNSINFCSDATYKITIGCILFIIILFIYYYYYIKNK